MKNTLRSFVIFCVYLLVLYPLSASAVQAQDEHPIEQWTGKCLTRDPSTVGMLNCLQQAYQKWDAALNQEYQRLRGLLNEDGKAALRDAQRGWIAYRDQEFKAIDAIYGSLEGTMWSLANMSSKVEFVKHRTLKLQLYTESLLQR